MGVRSRRQRVRRRDELGDRRDRGRAAAAGHRARHLRAPRGDERGCAASPSSRRRWRRWASARWPAPTWPTSPPRRSSAARDAAAGGASRCAHGGAPGRCWRRAGGGAGARGSRSAPATRSSASVGVGRARRRARRGRSRLPARRRQRARRRDGAPARRGADAPRGAARPADRAGEPRRCAATGSSTRWPAPARDGRRRVRAVHRPRRLQARQRPLRARGRRRAADRAAPPARGHRAARRTPSRGSAATSSSWSARTSTRTTAIALGHRLTEAIREPLDVDGVEHRLSASIGIALGTAAPRPGRAAAPTPTPPPTGPRPRAAAASRCSTAACAGTRASACARPRRWSGRCRSASCGSRFQPIVALADGAVVGARGAAALGPPGRRRERPADFIPVAEESGADRRDRRLGAAARRAPRPRAGRRRARCGSTSRAASLRNRGRRSWSPTCCAETGLPPARLRLEVTEAALIERAAARALRALHELGALGVGLVLDDFGTGYSSLGHLRDLPLTAVKIDRTFVAGAGARRGDTAMAAHRLAGRGARARRRWPRASRPRRRPSACARSAARWPRASCSGRPTSPEGLGPSDLHASGQSGGLALSPAPRVARVAPRDRVQLVREAPDTLLAPRFAGEPMVQSFRVGDAGRAWITTAEALAVPRFGREWMAARLSRARGRDGAPAFAAALSSGLRVHAETR